MGFFDGAAPEPARLRPRKAWARPEAAIPAVLGTEIVLARTTEAAIALTGVRVYPNGFELWLFATLKSQRRPLGTTMLLGDFQEGQEVRPEFLRFGLQFSDGTRCTNLSPGPGMSDDEPPAGAILQMMMAGGGRHSGDWRLWVWPLPPAGPLTFVCEWPAFDIPETRTAIDGQLILDAADRSLQLWPEADTW